MESERSAEEERPTVVPAMVVGCAAPLFTWCKVALDFRKPERAHWEAEVPLSPHTLKVSIEAIDGELRHDNNAAAVLDFDVVP